MFCLSYNNFIPGLQFAAISMGYDINAMGCARSKNYFLAKAGIEKAFHLVACLLISICRLLREGMYPTVNIRILKAVIMNYSVNNGLWFLTCSGIVKIDQWLVVDLPEQNREIGSNFVYSEVHSD